jgi:hypothetical protein
MMDVAKDEERRNWRTVFVHVYAHRTLRSFDASRQSPPLSPFFSSSSNVHNIPRLACSPSPTTTKNQQ